jgi:hypothetical protein
MPIELGLIQKRIAAGELVRDLVLAEYLPPRFQGGFLPLLFDLPRQELVEDGGQVGGGWGQRGSREGGTRV